MNNTILALVVTAVLTAGTAYAEESVVQVPFESHGQSCTFDEIAVEYQCVWQGVRDVFTIEDLKEFKSMLSEQTYDRELARLTEEAMAEIAVEKAKLTPNERTIQEIEEKLDRGIATATDSVYMNLLKELNTCKQGMDKQTAPFQTAREFEISEFNLWQVNNVKVNGHLGDLILAVEECRGQQKLLKIVGEGYSSMPTGEDDYQFSLQDKYTPDIQAVNYDSLLATNNSVNTSLICDSNQHSQQYKKQFGCMMLYDGLSAEEIKRQNEIRFGTDGKIQYQSQVLDDYMDFMSNYGDRQATVEDKKVQELIAEPIANDMIESNNFYQNKLKNGD